MENGERWTGNRLADAQELDVEDESAVGGNPVVLLASVRVLGRDSESALTTDLHVGETNLPALDNLSLSELEREWGAALVG